MLISSNSTMYHLYHQKAPEEVEAQQALQESAKAAAKSGQTESDATSGTNSFMVNALEQLVANKIGVDKEKLDELKKEIEALQNVENPSKGQQERLSMLTEKLGEMVRESAERAAEQKTQGEQDNKLQSYQSIAAMTSL